MKFAKWFVEKTKKYFQNNWKKWIPAVIVTGIIYFGVLSGWALSHPNEMLTFLVVLILIYMPLAWLWKLAIGTWRLYKKENKNEN